MIGQRLDMSMSILASADAEWIMVALVWLETYAMPWWDPPGNAGILRPQVSRSKCRSGARSSQPTAALRPAFPKSDRRTVPWPYGADFRLRHG